MSTQSKQSRSQWLGPSKGGSSDVSRGLSFVLALGLFLTLAAVDSRAANQKIFWRDNGTGDIRSANLDGTGAGVVIPAGLSSGNAVAVDDVGGKLYFSSSGATHRIHRSNLDGTGIQNLVVTAQATGPTSIDIDPIAQEIYWVDNGFASPNTVIRKANLDGTSPVTVLNLGNAGIGELRLDVALGKMYWTNFTPADQIYQANLDGTGVVSIVANGLSARGVALDATAAKLYWTDLGTGPGRVKRCNTDGTGVQTLSTTSGWYGIDLDPGAGKLYWTTLGTIKQANLDGTGAFDLLTTPVTDPREIDVALCTLAPLVTTPSTGCEILVCPLADGTPLGACSPTVTVVDGVCDPISGQAASTIWLGPYVPGDLVLCGLTPADGPTNALGQTTLSAPFSAGGYTGRVSGDPNCAGGLQVFVGGAPVPAPPIPIIARSPDYNGDLIVDSVDQTTYLNADFATWIATATLPCRSDFVSDGALNLLDVAVFAAHSGHTWVP